MFYPLLFRDCIEITFFSFGVYTFCIWLKTDKTNNLLPYFLSYCALSLIAWHTQLQTLTPFLFAYTPIALIIFILLHEKTLQKNFVTLRNPQAYPDTQHNNWLDIVLSCTLSGMNAEKKVTFVIEQNDALLPFLCAPFYINALLTKELLDIIITSTEYDEQKMIWIDMNGTLKSINTTWPIQKNDIESDAIFYSTHTDMIIFHTNLVTRTSTLIVHGKEFSSLSAQNLRMLIKKQVATTMLKKNKEPRREYSKVEESLFL